VTKPVRTNPFADDEILRYVTQYTAISPQLGRRLWNEIQGVFERLSTHPLSGEVVPRARVHRTARRVPLRQFPFFLIYRDHPDHIEIMALAHTSRRPYYWRSRFH
jgi:plasmid stabilization system protein ParE